MKKKLSILLACMLAMMLLVTSLTASASASAMSREPDNTDIKYVKYVKCRIVAEQGTAAEPNYVVEPNTAHRPEISYKDMKKNDDVRTQTSTTTTDGEIARYQAQYAKLRAKFEYMFKLKNVIEKEQSVISDKWNEYYALNNIYNNELEKLAKDFAINL